VKVLINLNITWAQENKLLNMIFVLRIQSRAIISVVGIAPADALVANTDRASAGVI